MPGFSMPSLLWGSSPLARGTRGTASGALMEGGLIPARAGNTDHRARPSHLQWAHPRSRGEHFRFFDLGGQAAGSSPLARGTLSVPVAGAGGGGLIPARAGNTPGASPALHKRRAHPRSRGEHCGWSRFQSLGRGSSPLARGTPRNGHYQDGRRGLIPARAGNTVVRNLWGVRIWAHPRSRGEHRA